MNSTDVRLNAKVTVRGRGEGVIESDRAYGPRDGIGVTGPSVWAQCGDGWKGWVSVADIDPARNV